jgi:hypothetical protein
MENVEVKMIEGKLHLIVDTDLEPRPPKPGKSMPILASSCGFTNLMVPNGKTLKVSLNVGE